MVLKLITVEIFGNLQPYLQDVDWINPYKTLDSVEREMTEQRGKEQKTTKKKKKNWVTRSTGVASLNRMCR